MIDKLRVRKRRHNLARWGNMSLFFWFFHHDLVAIGSGPYYSIERFIQENLLWVNPNLTLEQITITKWLNHQGGEPHPFG